MIRINNFIFYSIIFVSQIFLHFVFYRPGNFPLTLAPFVLLFFLNNFFSADDNFIKNNFPWIFSFICFFPWFNAIYVALDGMQFDQFLRTYALWCFSFGAIFVSIFAKIKIIADIATPSFFSLLVVTIFVALQSIYGSQGDTSYFNIFGSHQYFGEIDLNNLMVEEKIRPPGFYLEPSFCAYVVSVQCTICMLQRKWVREAIFLSGVAILFIQSLTGLLGFIVLLVAHFYCKKEENTNKSEFFLGAIIICFFFIGIVFYFYGEYIYQRFDQVDDVGSSTYYRLVGLLPVLFDTLVDRPLGWPLGAVKSVVPKYMIPHGIGYGESIDNGIYLIIFYFGWIGVFSSVMWICCLLFFIKNRNYPLCVGSTAILVGCFFNGGIFLPEFSLMTVFVVYSVKWRILCQKNYLL